MEINGKQVQMTTMDALKIIRDHQQQQFKLTQERAQQERLKHRKITLRGFKYNLEDPEEYRIHAGLIKGIGDNYMLREFSGYQIDEHNQKVLKFLTYYFNGCKLAESVFPDEDYKINGHIDRYTFNELADLKAFEGSPFNVCLNDLGLMTEKQKSFGTTLTQVTDEFLFARYEIYQQYNKRYHITSNLTVKDLKSRFEDRLVDRFKSFNVIELHGESRRK